jgi:hypothetical protein
MAVGGAVAETGPGAPRVLGFLEGRSSLRLNGRCKLTL